MAIIQALYGANMSTATGDDVYDIVGANNLGAYFKAIWDAGGTDTLRYTGLGDVRIDLRAATLDSADGMLAGGIASRVIDLNDGSGDPVYGGFTIANGVVIENAIGGDGDDLLMGNDAKNTIEGNGGTDMLYGSNDTDTLAGGSGMDLLFGGGNADVLKGHKGMDILYGDAGNDTLYGGDGIDTLYGAAAGDVIYGGNGNDLIQGGSHGDTLHGDSGKDTIEGNSGTDELRGGGGKDTLKGHDHNDTLYGGNGRDKIYGGDGNDILIGGGGADVFLYGGDLDEGTDTITDFNNGTDIIEIGCDITYDALIISQVGSDKHVSWLFNTVILQGINGAINEDDFSFI